MALLVSHEDGWRPVAPAEPTAVAALTTVWA